MSSRGYPFEEEPPARQTSTARARHTGRDCAVSAAARRSPQRYRHDPHDGYDITRSRHIIVRLFFYEERYVGTWRHWPRRGQMHGVIEKQTVAVSHPLQRLSLRPRHKHAHTLATLPQFPPPS